MSFYVESQPDCVRVTFPTAAISREAAQAAAREVPAELECTMQPSGDHDTVLELRGAAARHHAANLFARVNGYPEFPLGLLRNFRNSERPLVSCILLLPFNEVFARNVILPSLIKNSAGQAIEILLVCAGFGIDRRPFQHLPQFESELTSIARGYNLGVRHARGEYVALLHDDCFVDDPLWIPKALEALNGGAVAVTPEFDRWQRVPVAKAVPLVMRRSHFEEFGGYDEYYFAGVEDMEFTVRLMAAGWDVRSLDIGYRHLRGMGTSLILHENPRQLKLLFGYQLLPAAVISHIHRDMMQRLLSHGWIRMLEGDYHLHFLKKHGAFVASRFGVDIDHTAHAYQMMRHPYLLTPEMAYLSDRGKLVEAYRSLMNVPELMRAEEGEENA